MVKGIKELFNYRELIFNLVSRELKVKYKRSVLGFFWSFVNPLLLMAVYTVVFFFFLRVAPPTGANGLKNFPAFLLCGLLAWNYFNNSLSASVGSLVDSGNLLKKVYFPREIIPFSIVFANLINFLIELVVLFGFLLILGNNFLLLLPVLVYVIFIETIFVLSLSLIFSLSNVYFRDTKHLLGVILLLWFFATPIIYPFNMVVDAASKIGASWILTLYQANPMASLVLIYQKILYFVQFPSILSLAATTLVSMLLFIITYKIFKKYELFLTEEV